MNIRELSTSEIMQVDGADLGPINGFETGSVIGTVIGYAATGTVAGASRFGLIGGAIGFSAGLGWGLGDILVRDLCLMPPSNSLCF
ncbi:complement resistance protein TraT [Xylella fastidiosa]|uniref:complement resistance protein TraT n=1 Tax=Xylella fastidiosa TaxID=2371 RepID=UPI0021CC4FA1|nr:complement resistance protein TraT [Xylella fastidiosa]